LSEIVLLIKHGFYERVQYFGLNLAQHVTYSKPTDERELLKPQIVQSNKGALKFKLVEVLWRGRGG